MGGSRASQCPQMAHTSISRWKLRHPPTWKDAHAERKNRPTCFFGSSSSLTILRPIYGPQQFAYFRKRHVPINGQRQKHGEVMLGECSAIAIAPRSSDFLAEVATDPDAVTKLRLLFGKLEVAGQEFGGFIKSP